MRPPLLLVTLLWPLAAAAIDAPVPPPPETRQPVDLERELRAPWQAGGEIVLYAAPDGAPRAGRRTTQPADAEEERARRAEHFALARKLNLVTQPRVVPFALPLVEAQIELLERFAFTDAGAVWFREVADDTLRLLNKGYLEYDAARWRAHLDGGPRPRLSELINGRLSEAGQFAQDTAVFRIYAYEGAGSMAAAASVRMGNSGFRCQFQISGEAVDPFAILSHEFGHSRYGDPWSAGLPLGEARTVARYENPVRMRNGYPPRLVYYLRIPPGRAAASTRDPLLARLLAWRGAPAPNAAELEPVQGLYCECPEAPTLRDCLASPSIAALQDCELRWVAVRVAEPESDDPLPPTSLPTTP
ncbi:MAG: hypothetical protein FD187_1249 [bacterium]|nr:MAG: hypothetical protein FD142_521 [bacterium]KAF0149322.1 MAG: hypothetical protein FD187_1249 [bacterium]KAF0169844.1 MAG: hypothetical protein FD158_231 [bacterium]TXT18571.1 MAG: hypothetical protein FD132_2059 [bacterium]